MTACSCVEKKIKKILHNVFSPSTRPFSASTRSTLEFNNIYSVLKTDTKVISVFLSFLFFYISGNELCITKGVAHHLSPTLARKQRTRLLWSFMHLEWELKQISTVMLYPDILSWWHHQTSNIGHSSQALLGEMLLWLPFNCYHTAMRLTFQHKNTPYWLGKSGFVGWAVEGGSFLWHVKGSYSFIQL